MDIRCDAVYSLVEVGCFELPKSVDDLVKTKDIMLILEKAKVCLFNKCFYNMYLYLHHR